MDLDDCRIRVMTAADLDIVVDLEQQLQSHPWRRGHFENCLAIGNLALVVVPNSGKPADNSIIAYAIVSVGGGEAELLNLGVNPAYQRRGIGEGFLNEILTNLKTQAETVFLEVRMSNTAAIALYEKLGFNQAGIRPHYYPAAKGREDALLYAMSLL